MEIVTEIWGLSISQTLLLLAAILIIIDFFLPTDLPTHVAYILLCILAAIHVEAHILVKILCALLMWFVCIAFHYYIWRIILQKVANNIVAPDKFTSGADGVVGSRGIIRLVEGHHMVQVKGDLWPCRGAEGLQEGATVKIISQSNGELNVTKE